MKRKTEIVMHLMHACTTRKLERPNWPR